ncbi:hypothetical protein TWF481_000092 [Arthrobotrys musiformis]|uniref:RBR-type E3 ubiquitin transferase n=1 Tax=Arthrobotrys musiformis TaxID=47236 RepID=A0AAV9WLK2_9PEZI
MAPRNILRKVSALGKDPATAAEAGQTIHAHATALGWTSGSKPSNRQFTGERNRRCSICGDSFLGYELQRLSCGHRHCRDCLRQNFQYVINDPTAYPPKCCQLLPLADTSFVLSDEEMKAVLELQSTYEASKIIPCFSCEENIYLSDIGKDAAYCMKCDKLTCTICRKEMHNDLCPEDPGTDKLLAIAKEEGWTQCPKCSRLIFRISGCNSMTCICKTIFCFRCGNPFKPKCACAAIPWEASDPMNKSKAAITFGKTFSPGSTSRGASYQERQNYKILRTYRTVALRSRENHKIELKDLKSSRQLKSKQDEIAKEIIRLRVKMGELAVIEKAQRKEKIKAFRSGEVLLEDAFNDAGKVIVTRRNIYTEYGAQVRDNDDRPVSKRTRSQISGS